MNLISLISLYRRVTSILVLFKTWTDQEPPEIHQETTRNWPKSRKNRTGNKNPTVPVHCSGWFFIDPLNPATKFLFLPYGNQGGREYSIFAEFHVRLLLLSSSCPGDIITIGVRKYAGDQISTWKPSIAPNTRILIGFGWLLWDFCWFLVGSWWFLIGGLWFLIDSSRFMFDR